MAVEIKMPQWGMTMKKGKITRWIKNEGDKIQKGEDLFEVETEKITNIVESIASGVLFQVIVPAGETVAVKTVVGIIAEEGEIPIKVEAGTGAKAAETAGGNKNDEPVKASPAAKRLARELGVDIGGIEGTGPGGRITEKDVHQFGCEGGNKPKITPLAKSVAEKEKVDINAIKGTGQGGKITREDVEKAMAPLDMETPAIEKTTPVSTIPYEGMRKAIGDNMRASLQNTAQLTCFAEIDVTELVRFKDAIREEYSKDETIKISFNDIIIMAVSRVLKHHPIMNSTFEGGEIILHDDVNMGVAVAVKNGLMVPVLKKANEKGLLQIAREARILAGKARDGSLNMDDISNGSFTVSNTSMLEVDGFTPILRPPETGILGIGRAKMKPAEYKGEVALRWMMVISLTYDHCVVDGAPAHAFLAHIGRYLENPYLIMS